MTKVINLFGAANSGKSTTAAGLYYSMKLKHLHCELVREYVKNWCYEDRAPSKWDQPYIGNKQMKYESLLYRNNGTHIAKASMLYFTEYARSQGVEYCNFWFDTVPHIDTRGRYQTEDEIKAMSAPMKEWCKQICKEADMDLIEINTHLAEERIEKILSSIL
jgi:hypothetical protein